MGEHYPRIRHHASGPEGPRLLVREVVRIAFYMPHDHHDLAAAAGRALDVYLAAVGLGPEALCYGWDTEGEGDRFPLDRNGWEDIRGGLLPPQDYRFLDDLAEASPLFQHRTRKGFDTFVLLTGGTSGPGGYTFSYRARLPWRSPPPGSMSILSATLPTEHLERHGPGKVRDLALELASHLPFATGHAGLAFDLSRSLGSTLPLIREDLFRYPGLDLPEAGMESRLGARVDGVHWLNFLGAPVLGKLGGAEGLRSQLHSPETTVQEVKSESVVVTLGPWPEAGDLRRDHGLPAYRELARALEPWMASVPPCFSWPGVLEEEARRWWYRFLDGSPSPRHPVR